MASSSQSSMARKTWELSNQILDVTASEDIYKWDRAQQQSMLQAKPWEKDPHFFKVKNNGFVSVFTWPYLLFDCRT